MQDDLQGLELVDLLGHQAPRALRGESLTQRNQIEVAQELLLDVAEAGGEGEAGADELEETGRRRGAHGRLEGALLLQADHEVGKGA